MIETRLLQQFVAVAETLNFRKAAQRLEMSQPPLSMAIRKLEEEIGTPLFERTNRTVTLTPAGSAFLVRARAVLATLDEGVATARHVSQGIEGHLSVSFISLGAYPFLMRGIRSFCKAAPSVALTLMEATTDEQVCALETAECDLAFLRPPGTTSSRLCYEEICSERLFVAVPMDHPLARKSSVALSQLKNEPFVAPPRSPEQRFHDQLMDLCLSEHFSPRVVQTAERMTTIIGMVACGFGIALVPGSMAIQPMTDVVFKPVNTDAPQELCTLRLFMAWNAARPSLVRYRFMEEIRRQIRPRSR